MAWHSLGDPSIKAIKRETKAKKGLSVQPTGPKKQEEQCQKSDQEKKEE